MVCFSKTHSTPKSNNGGPEGRGGRPRMEIWGEKKISEDVV